MSQIQRNPPQAPEGTAPTRQPTRALILGYGQLGRSQARFLWERAPTAGPLELLAWDPLPRALPSLDDPTRPLPIEGALDLDFIFLAFHSETPESDAIETLSELWPRLSRPPVVIVRTTLSELAPRIELWLRERGSAFVYWPEFSNGSELAAGVIQPPSAPRIFYFSEAPNGSPPRELIDLWLGSDTGRSVGFEVATLYKQYWNAKKALDVVAFNSLLMATTAKGGDAREMMLVCNEFERAQRIPSITFAGHCLPKDLGFYAQNALPHDGGVFAPAAGDPQRAYGALCERILAILGSLPPSAEAPTVGLLGLNYRAHDPLSRPNDGPALFLAQRLREALPARGLRAQLTLSIGNPPALIDQFSRLLGARGDLALRQSAGCDIAILCQHDPQATRAILALLSACWAQGRQSLHLLDPAFSLTRESALKAREEAHRLGISLTIHCQA